MIPKRSTIALSFLSLLAACGGPSDSATVPQAQPAEASSVTYGDHTVHFSAQRTDQLPATVARQYNIVRSKNRAMLNVSVIRDSDTTPVSASVEVKTVNLTGQMKTITVRKIEEQEAIYYIGESPVANGETLVFDIVVTPEGTADPIEVRFKRQFYTN